MDICTDTRPRSIAVVPQTQYRRRTQASEAGPEELQARTRTTNQRRNSEVARRWVHQTCSTPNIAGQYCSSKENEWADPMLY